MTEAQVIKALETKTDQELHQWIMDLPNEESLEATRIIGEQIKQNPDFDTNAELQEAYSKITQSANNFENTLIDTQVKELMHEIELDARIKDMQQHYASMVTVLANNLLSNPNDNNLKKMLRELKQIFVEGNLYDEYLWKKINHLL